LLTRTSPIDALEAGIAGVETKRRLRRFVNDFVFANLKLIGHNWRDHVFPSLPPANERLPRVNLRASAEAQRSIPQQDQLR